MEKVYSQSPPYNERDKLYLMHFCFAFVSRMWDLGMVLLMAILTDNSLFVVSLMGFMSALITFLMMPNIGSLMDVTNRNIVVQLALLVKVFLVCVVYYWCFNLVDASSTPQSVSNEIYLIPLLVSCVAVCFSTVTQSVEKDWIVVLSSGDSSWLSVTNSTLSQIDLVCATIAPVLTGVIFGLFKTQHAIIVLACTNALVTLCLMWFLRSLYNSWPALAVQHHPLHQQRPNTTGTAAGGWSQFVSDFLSCGCAGVLFSYSMLFLTCLSFGSIMIVYLLSVGVRTELVGAARGSAALIGCVGAAAFPQIKDRLGLYRTAQLAITCQTVLAVVAASTFAWRDRRAALIALMCSLLYMRTWIFDLAVRQIAQETIPEAVRGRVNGQWKSLMALFELSGFALAMMFPDPRHFWILCCISALMVILSLIVFTAANPNRDMIDFSSCRCCSGGYERIKDRQDKIELIVNIER